MDARERLSKVREVERGVAAGLSLPLACHRAGVAPRWFEKWRGRLAEGGLAALADAPRTGRPRMVEVSAADAVKLRARYLRTNRAAGCGSKTQAARSLAREGALSPEVCEAILRPRSSKHLLPTAVREALAVPTAMVERYRDGRAGQNDGIYAPGWLRMREDGSRRLLPGERQVWDDASVNVGVVVPWPRGGDKCSERFGVRVARFQLLLGLDCATDHVAGYAFVCRPSDAYGAGDVVRALHGVWSRNGYAPAEVVLEGGAWQAERTLRFLECAGVRRISAKGRPNQKLVEGFFNRLWTTMSWKLPPSGQVGRFRGEMKRETALFLAAQAGRLDPRTVFPSYEVFHAALAESIDYLEDEWIESRQFGRWRPLEAYRAANAAGNGVEMPADLWRHALPEEAEATVRRGGMVHARATSPHGTVCDYDFAWESGFEAEGRRVRVRFDPWNIGAGGVVEDAATGRVLAEGVPCLSPVPCLGAARGFWDARAAFRQVRSASRSTVLESVRALDERTGRGGAGTAGVLHVARGLSPVSKAPHLEEDADAEAAMLRAFGPDSGATDWAALEAEAGVIA